MKPHGPDGKARLNEFKQVSGEVSAPTGRTDERTRRGDPEYQARCGSCGRLLGTFQVARGEIKCPRCKHVQRIHIGGKEQKDRAA